MSAIEALAEAWASMDGKLETFRAEKLILPEYGTGTYVGYMAEAEEMQRRLLVRGYGVQSASLLPDNERRP
jgi:hypothetical protein